MKRAFTLIELLVVISIIGLLSSVVLASLNTARAKAALSAGKQESANVHHAIGDDAVLQMDLDDCSSSTAIDTSGNGNNGTVTGGATSTASNTPSGQGCSMAFNGINQWISVPHSSSLNPTGSVTFSFWIYPNAIPASADIIEKGIGLGLAQYYIRFNAGNLNFNFSNGTRAYSSAIPIGTLGIATGVWQHVVFTVDDAAQTGKVYVNGAHKFSLATPNANALAQNTAVLAVGGYSWDGYTNSLMDEVRIYSRSLTSMEVGKLYAAGLPKHSLAKE